MTDNDSANEWCLRIDTIYEFTINGCDAVQMNGLQTSSKRYTRNRKLLRDILTEASVRYCLFPEISIPQYARANKNCIPRIHWHGLMVFKDINSIINWLLTVAPALAKYGSYQFNTFRPDYWPSYCLKHQDIFEHLPGNYELKNSCCLDSFFEQILELV